MEVLKRSKDFREPARSGSIGVIDQKTAAVTTWKIPGHTNVDALALDEGRHRLFAASLRPGRLTVVEYAIRLGGRRASLHRWRRRHLVRSDAKTDLCVGYRRHRRIP